MGLSKSRFWWTKALTCLLGLTLVWYVFWWFHTFTIFVGVSQEYLLCTSIGCCSPDTKPALYEDLVFRDWPKRIGRSTWDGFDAWGYPQHGWFIMETAINIYKYIYLYLFIFLFRWFGGAPILENPQMVIETTYEVHNHQTRGYHQLNLGRFVCYTTMSP